MKVQSINSPYFNKKIYNINNTRKISTQPSFKGLFDNYDSKAIEYFNYGLQALDENSLLIATPNRKEAFFNLQQNKDKIDIPILKTYILDITKELDKDWGKSIGNSFAIFKKQDDYYILNLNNLGMGVYKGEYDSETSYLNSGDKKKLDNGTKINAFSSIGRRPLIFEKPRIFDTRKAEKFLTVKNTIDVKAQNTIAITKLTTPAKDNVSQNKVFTFDDIGGLDNVIEDMKKFVIRPLNYPQVFENIRLNKGILLYGPPRCGKTLLGKALAQEAGVPYKYVNANEFKNGAVGSTEATIRKTFEHMIQTPCILFIDEFDALGKKREGSHNARYDDAAVNQLLGCLSDLEKSLTNSFVIAATNRKDLLDEALVASGRFGLQIEIPMPNKDALEQIYNIHSKKQKIDENIDRKAIITTMFENKFNGSDVAEMITLGFFCALERMGLDKKMDARTFNYNDLRSIKIVQDDLLKAIKTIAKQKG